MRKKTIQVPMVAALNTRLDPRFPVTALVTRADNVYRTRTSEWAKRHGFTILPNTVESADSATIDTIRKLAARGNELVAFSTRRLWSWNPTLQKFLDLGSSYDSTLNSGRNTWPDQSVCNVELVRFDKEPPFNLGQAQIALETDVAVGGGCTLSAWTAADPSNYGYVFFTAVDTATGQLRRTVTYAGGFVTGSQRDVKVVFAGGWFLIFFVEEGAATSTLRVFGYNPTTNAVRSQVSVAADLMGTTNGSRYDVYTRPDNGRVLIAYRGDGAGSVRAMEWNGATNAASIAAVTVTATDTVCVGWVDTGTSGTTSPRLLTMTTLVARRILNGTTLVQSSALTIDAAPGDVSNLTGVYGWLGADDDIILYEVRHASDPERDQVKIATTNGGPTLKTFVLNASLASKAAFVTPTGGSAARPYVALRCPWLAQGAYFLASCAASGTSFETEFHPSLVARVLRGKAPFASTRRNAISALPAVSATKVAFAGTEIYDAVSTTSVITHFLRPVVAMVEFSGRMPEPVQFGDQLFIPGAMPRVYGGNKVSEVGWQVDPTKLTLTAVGSGGSLSAGTYQYTHVFVYEDDEGRIWRSGPGAVRSVTAVASDSITVVAKMPFLHSFVGGIGKVGRYSRIEIYRTKSNGTVFFRIPFASTAQLAITTNDIKTLTDTIADADLETNPQLYATSGELFNSPPPPCNWAVVQGDRIVVGDAEKPTRVLAFKEFQPGQGSGCHADLAVDIEADGPNYAGGLIEGRVVVFKRQAIYVLTGDWPDANGSGPLPLVQKIATGWGTIEPESVCQTTDGLWFKDPKKGLCFIDRGLQVTQPGKAVQEYDTNDIVAATIVEEFEQVRFLTATGGSPVYDYLEKQWATFLRTSVSIVTARTGAALAGGVYYISAGNRIYYYDNTSYSDNGSIVFGDLVLQLNFAGLQGIQRVDRLILTGEMVDVNGGMTVRLTDDHGGAQGREEKFIPKNQFSNQRDPLIQLPGTFALEIRPRNPRSTSLRLQVFWPNSLAASVLTAGVRLSGLAAEVGLRDKPGLRRLSTKMRA
jgi:hypothetical protein